MIIDCHGHYTTAPKELEAYRQAQIAGLKEPGRARAKGTLSITDDAAGSPHTVALVGTGVAAPAAGSGTPAGSYSVTVTGTVGTLTRTVAVTLVVQ